MLPKKNQNATKKLVLDFGLFWPFFKQKTGKIDQKRRKLAKSKPLMKFSEIWYVDASQQ